MESTMEAAIADLGCRAYFCKSYKPEIKNETNAAEGCRFVADFNFVQFTHWMC